MDEFGDDFIEMYDDGNRVLPRMVLPPSDVPPTMVDGEILNLLRAERAWLTEGTWILDFLVWGQICPPSGLDFLPRCFNFFKCIIIFFLKALEN